MKERVCQLFEDFQYEFVNLSLPCEGRLADTISAKLTFQSASCHVIFTICLTQKMLFNLDENDCHTKIHFHIKCYKPGLGWKMKAKRNPQLTFQIWLKCFANCLERFSYECRKVIGFAFTTLHDWLKRFAPLFHPIRSKTKTNCVIASRALR